MTIPEEEREVISNRLNRVAYHLEDGLGPNGLLGPYTEEQADAVRGLVDDLDYVLNWLEGGPERWEPVRELQSLRCTVQEDEPGDWHIDVSVIGELLVMEARIKALDSDVPLDVRLAAKLPPDFKLFRRVPSQPEAPEASCPRCGEVIHAPAEEEMRYYGDHDAVGERVTMYRCDKCGGLWGLGCAVARR